MTRLLLVLSALALVAGCGAAGPTLAPPPPPPPSAPVATVTLTPDSVSLVPGQTATFVAAPKDALGQPLQGRAISWSSLVPAIASVDGNGVVTAATAGSTSITAVSEGKSSTATITVGDGAYLGAGGGVAVGAAGKVRLVVPSQALSGNLALTIAAVPNPPPDPRLVAGTAFELGPSGTQFAVPVTLTIRYDAAVLTPAANVAQLRIARAGPGGEWTPLPGSTVDGAAGTVTAQTSSFSTYAVLEIPAPVATVAVTPPAGPLFVGSSAPLVAVLRDADGAILTGRAVTWHSSAPAVASVTSDGLVTGLVAGGPVSITATSEGQTGAALITVLAPVATVVVTPGNNAVPMGSTRTLTATLRDDLDQIVTGRPIVWTSSNPAIASVSGTGVITGVSVGGPVTITATAEGHSGTASAVVQRPVATVQVTPPTGTVAAGATITFGALLRDAAGGILPGRTIDWSSSNPAVASVSAGGVVTGIAEGGPVTITATSEGRTGTALVTVTPRGILAVPVHQLATDSIQAVIPAPFVINVSGLLAGRRSGIPVEFQAGGPALVLGARVPFLFVGNVASGPFFTSFWTDTTDAQGNVAITLQRGTVTGHEVLTVSVPALALRDTVGFTITPGAMVFFRVTPADTALLVGAQYSPRLEGFDFHGNLVTVAGSLVSDSSNVTVIGGALRGLSLGRATITARVGARSQQIAVSVVPPGTIAVFRPAITTGDASVITIEATDGTSRRNLAPGTPGFFDGRSIAWAPDGTRILYHMDLSPGSSALFWVTNAGTVQRVIKSNFPFSQLWGTVSPDGRFVYFSVVTSDFGGQEIWRVGSNGVGEVRVGPPSNGSETDTHPAASPDGTRLAFATDRRDPSSNTFFEIALLDLATGSVRYTGVRGLTPRWSPDGSLLSYLAFDGTDAMMVMRPDGTAQRVVSLPGQHYAPGADWSRDGQWLLARNNATGLIDLIAIASGLTVPLPLTLDAAQAAWKP